MRNPSSSSIPSRSRRRALALAAALLVAACSTPARRPAPVEVQGEGGFTIREEVRVGSGVRADFDDAIRLLEQGQHDGAIPLLLAVTEAAPHLTTAHIDLAIAYSRANDPKRAEASLKTALDLSPRHPVAHNELGILYRKTGRFAEARKSYEQALAHYPGFHFARRNLAILCDLYLADPSCALEHYELYSRAVPEDEAAAMWLADLRSRAGR